MREIFFWLDVAIILEGNVIHPSIFKIFVKTTRYLVVSIGWSRWTGTNS